ncbi:hypothetical protein SSPO_041160 [Streptomyces antimycoticus]|uniref:Uncharacterized protein n=1 Tax=Streptomyces antimycoticus TaxID=68175 RepID=A0A499UNI7_9ACTN|nr:hypothetical protein SSPO_041160 [Streptomyces antimycoticus]
MTAEVHLRSEVVQVIAVELQSDGAAGLDVGPDVLPCPARGGGLLNQEVQPECGGQVPGQLEGLDPSPRKGKPMLLLSQ